MASKISKTEWKVVYIVMGALDFIQFVIIECILVWIFGIGALINEIADPIIGALFTGYLMFRGVELFKHMNRFASIAGMAALEEFTGGIAQLWILDVWYLHSDVKKEEAGIQAAQAQNEFLAGAEGQFYSGGTGRPRPEFRSPSAGKTYTSGGVGRVR